MRSPPAVFYVTTWVGTREGGAFESPSVILCGLDTMGRIQRVDQYDFDRLDEVRARFEELHPDPLPKAATPVPTAD